MKAIRTIGIALLSVTLALAVLAGGTYLWARSATGSSLVPRGIVWGDSDVGDLWRFPMRTVGAGPKTLRFGAATPAWLSELEIDIVVDRLDLPTDQGMPRPGELLDEVKSRLGLARGDLGVTPSYAMVYDIAGWMRGNGWGGSRIASGPTGCTQDSDPICDGLDASWGSRGLANWDLDGVYGDWYGAHEMGHTMSQTHISGYRPNLRGCSGSGAIDVYPGGRIGGPDGASDRYYGFDVGDPNLRISTMVYSPEWRDFMTYCPNQWISDYTYEGILDAVTLRPTQVDSLVNGESLLCTGTANLTQSTGDIGSLYGLPDALPASWAISSALVLRLENSVGNEQAQYPLNLEGDSEREEGEDEIVFFDAVVPWAAGTSTISILHEGREVVSRTVSVHAPVVVLTYPNGGETLGDAVTVTWDATDADEDYLHYAVLYSADGGSNWRTLVTSWPEPSYTLSTDRLEGSTIARFRVIASDGVNTGRDDSDGNVAVPFKPPDVQIDFPPDGSTFVLGQTVILSGRARGPDRRGISDSGYSWTSTQDGSLGTGGEIVTTGLSLGSHTIALRVRDSEGLSGEASIQLTVVEEWAATAAPGRLYLPLAMKQ